MSPLLLQDRSGTRKLENWLEDRGYTVEPGPNYCCWWQEKRVTYRPQDGLQTRLAGLLHECGHVLITRTVREGPSIRYKRGYTGPRTGKSRSKISTADLVHEEIEAWHRGYLLAKRLGIKLDLEAYWKTYGACIKGYFRKAARGAL